MHSASIVSKTLFIIPTDAHNYKIIGMLKTIKILTIVRILIVFNIPVILLLCASVGIINSVFVALIVYTNIKF